MSDFPVTLPAPQMKFNRLIWLLIGALLVIDGVLIWYFGFTVQYHQRPHVFITLIICALMALYYRIITRNDSFFLFGNLMNQAAFGGAALMMLNYLSSRANFPFIDQQLLAFDQLLGFNWLALVEWLDTQPVLAKASSIAYQSFSILPFLLILLLFLNDKLAQAQRMIFIFIITGFATAMIAALLPALGMFGYYDIQPDQLKNFQPIAGRVHEQVLLGLRDHSITAITYPPVGLVTFPSFHAVMAVLLIYTSWPLRRVRWCVVPLNILMLFSCLSDGGHYLADVLAGIALALLGIALAEKLLPEEKGI